MILQDVIGELLYIGIVAEKGRCYGFRWKYGYRKVLRIHIESLNKLRKCMNSNNIEFVCSEINEFFELCEKYPEIGKFYSFSMNYIENLYVGESYVAVDKLIDGLFDELIIEIRKMFINKRKVYDLLNVMHNLPRVYLGKNKNTLCNLKQESISVSDAINFMFSNLSNDMKEKYQKILIDMEKVQGM